MPIQRYPRKIRLLPGRRWAGTMTLRSRSADDLWLVDFDAVVVGASEGTERWVGDRATLTAQQIFDWTGVNPSK
jgi:hypothetical protein